MTASTEHGEARLERSRSCVATRRFMLALAGGVLLAAVAAWFGRDALLRDAADAWIVSDQPAHADAVAVFGGGLEYRPFAAAEYYRRGLVAKVLVSNIGSSRAERLGVLKSHVEANIEVLQKLGVPAAAIETFGRQLTDTYSEARALHQWAMDTGARTIMVPTDLFATRRLRWTLHQVFGTDALVLVPALSPFEYRSDDWWQNEAGLIAFQNEIIKYVYYRTKY
jgi:uncharacterized SAM-binding protein YcdF (DUF218 family)